jgi:basic membrane protein A
MVVSNPEFGAVILTSITRRIDLVIDGSINDGMTGRFSGGTIVYTIRDGVLVLAPFHEISESIPASLKAEIDDLKDRISYGVPAIDE